MAHEPMLSRNPDVVFRSIESGGVLLNVKSGAYHEVNSTGREIWEALDTPCTLQTVVARLRDQFGEVPDLDADIDEFIAGLAERDLVVIEEEDSTQE